MVKPRTYRITLMILNTVEEFLWNRNSTLERKGAGSPDLEQGRRIINRHGVERKRGTSSQNTSSTLFRDMMFKNCVLLA